MTQGFDDRVVIVTGAARVQNLRSGRDMRGLRPFVRMLARPGTARDKDHRRLIGDSGEMAGVMSRR